MVKIGHTQCEPRELFFFSYFLTIAVVMEEVGVGVGVAAVVVVVVVVVVGVENVESLN